MDRLRRLRTRWKRRVVHGFWDEYEKLTRCTMPLVPPRSINQNTRYFFNRAEYATEFLESGNRIKECLVEYGGLKPSDNVLDIGCGIGRVARPLTEFLASGTYEGLDADPRAMAWCQDAYASFQNFNFRHLSVNYLDLKGEINAGEASLPYPDEAFDFVFTISVYTHLAPVGIARYLAETRRVMKPTATTVNTFFVLDEQAMSQVEQGRTTHSFPVQMDGFRASNPVVLEAATAYTPEQVRSLHAGAGLELVEPIRYGSWSGRDNKFIYQDIVVSKASSFSVDGHAKRGHS